MQERKVAPAGDRNSLWCLACPVVASPGWRGSLLLLLLGLAVIDKDDILERLFDSKVFVIQPGGGI